MTNERMIEKEILQQVELEEDTFCFPNIRKMRGWKSFIILLLGGTILFGGAAVYLIIKNPENTISLLENDPVKLTAIEPHIVRWSIWITFLWIIFILLWFFILILPGIIINVVTASFGYRLSQRIQENVEYLNALHKWIVWFVWQVLALISFQVFFIRKDLVSLWISVDNYLNCALIFSFVFLVQKFIIQKIAFNFHQVAYQDRIIESKTAMLILSKLRKSIKSTGLGDIFDSQVQSSKPAQNPFISLFQSKAKSMDQIQIEIDDRHVDDKSIRSYGSSLGYFDSKGNFGQMVKDISIVDSDEYAKKLGEQLFFGLCPRNANELFPSDFRPFFQNDVQTSKVFLLFDRDDNGSITRDELVCAVQRIYSEKRSLNHSMRDLTHALGNLNSILTVFSVLLGILLCFPFLGLAISSIVPFTSILLALSFVFGGSAKATFDCIVFLFVVHPFDAGDRIFIDGASYLVEELTILTTTLGTDGKKFYIPNEIMAKKTILNARRSGDMVDFIELKVDLFTPNEKMQELEKRMLKFTTSNPRQYLPQIQMDILDMGISNMMTFRFSIPFKGNWQDGGKRWATRTKFLFALKENVNDLGIKFELPVQSVFMMQNDQI
jgi:small-conductance mechanosensitive channel